MLRVDVRMRIAAMVLLIFFAVIVPSETMAANEQICDVAADIALGLEDYPTTILLHRRLLRSDRNDALAHYHLGFAYGMVGRVDQEIVEYLAAISLGLDSWDLFLNLGLAYLGQQKLVKATAALETAVLLGPEHPEAHFDLAIAYERSKRLPEALHEIASSLRLRPQNPDDLNTEALIYAELGDPDSARNVWARLEMVAPEYAAARVNLAILNTHRDRSQRQVVQKASSHP